MENPAQNGGARGICDDRLREVDVCGGEDESEGLLYYVYLYKTLMVITKH